MFNEVIRYHRLSLKTRAPTELIDPSRLGNRLDRPVHLSPPPRELPGPFALLLLLSLTSQATDV